MPGRITRSAPVDSRKTCIDTDRIMKPVEGLAEARACYCLAARKRARELTRLYEEKLRPYGLRATQFSILAVLGLKGAMRVGDLADVLGLERTTLTRSASVLERDGRIVEAPAEDARERRWQLTSEGRRAVEAALPAWREAQREVAGTHDHETARTESRMSEGAR